MGSGESHFNVSVGSDGQSHKSVSTNHNLFEEKRKAEAVSNRGPSAYQPNALPLGQTGSLPIAFLCCFTSMEARWLIRDEDRVGRGRKSEGSTSDTARKRPERPWTTTRTMEVLRRCPLAIAQRLVHCAIAVSTVVLGQGHKDNVRCTLTNNLSNFLSPAPPPYS